MVLAGFADVGATVGVFRGIEVAEVLELIVFLHMAEDGFALPVGSFEVTVFGALLSDLDFIVDVGEVGIDFLLAFGADAFCLTQIKSTPAIASTISAKGSSIMDIVTMRSYLRMFVTVDADVNKRREE